MAFTNWASFTIRASALTVGTSGQDTAVTLPETITSFWAVATKTTEANADNLFTVRLQAQVDSLWVDLSWTLWQETVPLVDATDAAGSVTPTPNIHDADTTAPTVMMHAYYAAIPSNVIRSIWVVSGTGPAVTFSVVANYQIVNFNG